MYIEIYLDSLFLLNFVINFCLLTLLHRAVFHSATGLRLVLGAAVGAGFSLLPLMGEGYVALKAVCGVLLGTGLMLLTAFRIRSLRAFWRLLERLLFFSFLLGGGLLALLRRIPLPERYAGGIFGVMGFGVLLCLAVLGWMERSRKQERVCQVTLIGGEGRVKLTALVDSGNTLEEPISGKPVCVIEETVLRCLWREEPYFYRIIPYRSVGKSRGVMKGYLLPEMHIEMEGVTKICRDVYVAVSEEALAGVGMLVNPVLLKK